MGQRVMADTARYPERISYCPFAFRRAMVRHKPFLMQCPSNRHKTARNTTISSRKAQVKANSIGMEGIIDLIIAFPKRTDSQPAVIAPFLKKRFNAKRQMEKTLSAQI
jgi:hypothetical protein